MNSLIHASGDLQRSGPETSRQAWTFHVVKNHWTSVGWTSSNNPYRWSTLLFEVPPRYSPLGDSGFWFGATSLHAKPVHLIATLCERAPTDRPSLYQESLFLNFGSVWDNVLLGDYRYSLSSCRTDSETRSPMWPPASGVAFGMSERNVDGRLSGRSAECHD